MRSGVGRRGWGCPCGRVGWFEGVGGTGKCGWAVRRGSEWSVVRIRARGEWVVVSETTRTGESEATRVER